MMDINWIAVVVAAVSAFVLGGLWYSPVLFGKAWTRASGVEQPNRHPGLVFGVAFVLSLLAAIAFALFLDAGIGWQRGLAIGLATGAAVVATSFGINYLFENKSLRLWLINGGYHTAQFALYGVIVGGWPQ